MSLLLDGFTISEIIPEGSATNCDDNIHFLYLNSSRLLFIRSSSVTLFKSYPHELFLEGLYISFGFITLLRS